MQQQVTNHDLLNWSNELNSWGNSVVKVLLRSKIQDFEKRNGLRIETIRTRYHEIDMAHYVYEPDGKGNLVRQYDGEGDKKQPRLTGATTEEEYQKQINDLMAEKNIYEY